MKTTISLFFYWQNSFRPKEVNLFVKRTTADGWENCSIIRSLKRTAKDIRLFR